MTRRYFSLLLVLALLAGCGVPTEDNPRAVQPPPGPFPTPATGGSTAPSGRVDELLYFVRDDRLVPIVRRVDTTPTLDGHLQHLLAGPTADERDKGLTSALPGAVTVAAARQTGARADVDIREAGDETGRSDAVLALGQIVRTLAARDDIDTVAFTRHGQPLGVPRADGSLSVEPLTAADYAALTVP
ncbi:GerMN domain-containing protein [Micromonospora sp. NBC_00898]|uniref:GerMN domain-containing protein n=1 Tax=Micromonospora sp. NBC_00898 TaxID=2975981 RepID=UPI00386890D3|nr:GerMN domain-containing protein [Micromonospora sp. NBC_00898]